MKKLLTLLLFCQLFSCEPVMCQTDSVQHEIRIVLENQNYSAWNNTAYINSLRNLGAEFMAYDGIEHPSENNYTVIGAGINFHIVQDGNPGYRSRNNPNSYTQVNAIGKSYATYNQAMIDKTAFVQAPFFAKHDWTFAFANIPISQRKSFNQIPNDLNQLENLSDIVLDINNDGHDTSPAFVNTYFQTNAVMQKLIAWVLNPVNKARLWITTDENAGGTTNHVLCFVIGYNVKAGAKINTRYNHFNLFNTNLFNLGAVSCNQAIGIPAMTGWKKTIQDTVIPIDTTKKLCWKYGSHDSTITTITHKQIKDSVQVACDTVPVDTSSNYFVFGFYEQFYNQTAKSKTLLDVLIRDCNAKKITDLHCYDVNGLTAAEIKAMNTRIKAECPTIRHIIDCTTNGMPHDGFDGVNNEIEPWTAGGSQDIVWINSRQAFLPIANAMKAAGKSYYWHFGWWNTPLMALECPPYLVKNTSAVMLHDYRKVPNDGYVKSRLDAIEAAGGGKIIVYPSYELVFSQSWNGTMLDWYNQFKVWFDAQHYQKCKLIGIMGFTRQLYNVNHPVPPANAIQSVLNIFRSKANRNPTYEGFDSKETINNWAE